METRSVQPAFRLARWPKCNDCQFKMFPQCYTTFRTLVPTSAWAKRDFVQRYEMDDVEETSIGAVEFHTIHENASAPSTD